MQDSASFWTDIKNLEEQLAKTPGSLCFARLSDVYLKVGLIDDALHVARKGVAQHPRYLSGQRTFALACHAKGLDEEALTALKLVTEALPEDVSSQKLLGRLSADAGNHDAAMNAFRTALEFASDDVECRIELESLERSAGISSASVYDDEEIIDLLEIYEEFDVAAGYQQESEPEYQVAPPEPETPSVPHHDPLSTGTLAELYVTQGFVHKALEIYRAILVDNPADRATAERVVELEALEAGSSEPYNGFDETFVEEAGDEDAFGISSEELLHSTAPSALSDSDGPAEDESQKSEAIFGVEKSAVAVPLQGVADNARATLEGWLENIRRIKSCR
jgi:tetratricopeptide (TPR) repeat protein